MTASEPTPDGDKELGSGTDITRIETMAHVGERRLPAVVIWFGEDRAIRYVWDMDCGDFLKQTWLDGRVLEEQVVGTCRAEMTAYALEFVAEYIDVYRDNEEALAKDRPDVHELLAAAPNAE